MTEVRVVPKTRNVQIWDVVCDICGENLTFLSPSEAQDARRAHAQSHKLPTTTMNPRRDWQ